MANPTSATQRPGSGSGKQGWEKNCECGFMVRDYNQKEFVQMVQNHSQGTHHEPMSEKEVLADAKPIRM
jgi:predicted small metal-binding protein